MGMDGNGWVLMGMMGGNGIIKKKGKGENFEFAKLRITR